MKTSDSIAELATALTKAQSEFDPVYKDGKSYTNKYATLQNMVDTVRPVLKNNGLSFTQMPGASEHIDQIVLTSRLMHSSGQWIEETMTIPVPQVGKANAAQNYGAGLTYARRYSLESMLGIAATEDTDANGAQPQQAKQPQPTKNGNGAKLSGATRRKLHAVGTQTYGDGWNSKRADMSAAFGVGSSNDWTEQQAQKVIDGMTKILNERAAKNQSLFDDEPEPTGAYAE